MRFLPLVLWLFTTETLTIPRDAMPRATNEVELMKLLNQDLHDTSKGMVDLKLRKEINKRAEKLKKQQ